LVPGDQKNQVQTVLRQAQNAHNTNSLNWNLTRQGRNILCEWRNAPLYDHCGRISGIACLATDVTERQQMQEYLEHHAHYDALTELPNRLLFFDRLEQAAIQARRYRSGFALLYIDLDEFKAVNDRFGHAAGDEVLKETVRRMRAAVRESDTVARLGGDEFIILLVEMAKPEDAEAMALKLVETINQPILLAEGAAVVGAAIGIALYPRDGEGVQELLNKADNAMYVAKGCGKNTYRWCLPG
jgi:diguanylate cyclase (GGDEF)-like protein